MDILIGIIVLTIPWWYPMLRDYNKRLERDAEHIKRHQIIKERFENIKDVYHPMFGDFNNHIITWYEHEASNSTDWWSRRYCDTDLIIIKHKYLNK
jgi:DNA polymerase elongation subunit (family B)